MSHKLVITIDNVTLAVSSEGMTIMVGQEQQSDGGFINLDAKEAHAFALAWNAVTGMHEVEHE